MRNPFSDIAKRKTKKTERSEYGSGEDTDQLIKSLEELEKSRSIISSKLLKKIGSLERYNVRLIELEEGLKDLLSGGKEKDVREKLELLSNISKGDLEKIPNLTNTDINHDANKLLEQVKPKLIETLAEVLKSDEVLEDLRLEFLKTLADFPPEKKDKLESLLLAFQIGALLPDINELEYDQEKLDRKCEMAHSLAEALGDIEVVDIKNQWKHITELEIRILHDTGIMLLKTGEYEKAYKCFDDITKINPKSKKALLNRGIALGIMGKSEEEINCYDKALEVDQDYALAYYNKGISLKEAGIDVEAKQNLKKACEINSKLCRQQGGF